MEMKNGRIHKHMQKPIIGAHISTAGGLYTLFGRAEKLGINAVQIFGSSPRSWRAKMPSEEDLILFSEARKKTEVESIFLHAAYLVNIASANEEIYTYSKQSLIDHLSIAELIGAEGVIFHIGSSKGITKKEAIQKEIDAIKEILKKVDGKSKLIMENTAGGGEKIGETFEEFAELFNGAKTERLGICFDTAHAFEAGWLTQYSKKEIDSFFSQFDREIGIKNILAFHINDSMTDAGSHHDRHENIGEGKIGISGFKNLANEKRITEIPWLLEVPGFDGSGPDKKNVEILKKLLL